MIQDIKVWKLTIGILFTLIPIAFFIYYKVKLTKDVIISILRMVIQLSFVALYLEWLFDLNNKWINILWVILMIFVGTFTTIRRVKLNWKYFVVPLFISSLISAFIVDLIFIGFVLDINYFFDAQYFIPITGMILGNSLKNNIVGLNTYFNDLNDKFELYAFLQINTGNRKTTLHPFINKAVKQGLNPLIASTSVIGLISLPGMMTGQILGGSSPVVAIKYQIMIVVAIMVGCTINLFLSIIFSNRFVFDKYGLLKENVMKKVNKKQ